MIGRAYLWGLAANGQAGVESRWTCCVWVSTRRCSAWAIPSIKELSPADLATPFLGVHVLRLGAPAESR